MLTSRQQLVVGILALALFGLAACGDDTDGLDADIRRRIRSVVSAGGVAAAADMVPDVVAADIILPDADPAAVAEIGRSIGATTIAIRNFDTDAVEVGVAWARQVAALL